MTQRTSIRLLPSPLDVFHQALEQQREIMAEQERRHEPLPSLYARRRGQQRPRQRRRATA